MNNRRLAIFFLACSISIFLPQTSLSSTLKYQSTIQNSDTTETTIKQAKSTKNILLDDSKIIDITSSINTVKLETILLNVFGSALINELEINGFSVNEDSTIKELLSIIDPDNFIVHWATENPQETNKLLNKIIEKLISTTNTDITPSLRHALKDYHKLISADSMPKTRLPRSKWPVARVEPDPYYTNTNNKYEDEDEDKNYNPSPLLISVLVISSLLIVASLSWCSYDWLCVGRICHNSP